MSLDCQSLLEPGSANGAPRPLSSLITMAAAHVTGSAPRPPVTPMTTMTMTMTMNMPMMIITMMVVVMPRPQPVAQSQSNNRSSPIDAWSTVVVNWSGLGVLVFFNMGLAPFKIGRSSSGYIQSD